MRAQAEVRSDEVDGQPLGSKGIQPPPPEPDGHVCVHPALQYRVLRMKAESPIRATSTLVEPSTCPPSSCPGHYPRRLGYYGDSVAMGITACRRSRGCLSGLVHV